MQKQRSNQAKTFEGKPCRKCQSTIRCVAGGQCAACKRRIAAIQRADPEHRRKQSEYQKLPRSKEYHKRYRESHKEELREYFRIHDKERDDTIERKERMRFNRLRREYGIDASEYKEILEKQNNGCAICGKPSIEAYSKVLHVDHCHTTRKVRGLLCDCCNHLLGNAKDNPAILTAAIEYLNRNLSPNL